MYKRQFYDHSVSLARHLYETGMHPQIKSGEFYVVYFTDCRFGGETVDAVGLFKSETRDTFLDVEEQASGLHIAAHQGINVNKLDKGCVVFNTEREAGFAVCVAVSYTHLDVYKRQVKGKAMLAGKFAAAADRNMKPAVPQLTSAPSFERRAVNANAVMLK